MEFLKANGIDDPSLIKEIDYQEVLNQQEIYGEELYLFSNKDMQKEVRSHTRFISLSSQQNPSFMTPLMNRHQPFTTTIHVTDGKRPACQLSSMTAPLTQPMTESFELLSLTNDWNECPIEGSTFYISFQ